MQPIFFAGVRPYQLRRTLLAKQPRMLALLDLVAQKGSPNRDHGL